MKHSQRLYVAYGLLYTRIPENVIRTQKRTTAYRRLPEMLLNPTIVLIRQRRPVGRCLGLEPVEVVNLVPLVLRGVLFVGQLPPYQYKAPFHTRRYMELSTHIIRGDFRKSHPLAPLDNRPAPTPQPYPHVLTFMHAHLPCVHHQHRVSHARDMRRPRDMARHNQAARHIFHRETGKRACSAPWHPLGFVLGSGECGHRHVQHAPLQVCDAARGSSAGGGGGQDDVHAAVGADVYVARGGEGGLADAGAWLRGHFVIVVFGIAGGKGG